MRRIGLQIFAMLMTVSSLAQSVTDSLKQVLDRSNNDSTKFCLLVQLSESYTFNNADSSLLYASKAMALAEDSKNPLWIAHANYTVSLYFLFSNDRSSSLNYYFKNINEYEQYRDPYVLALSTVTAAFAYLTYEYYEKAFDYSFRTIALLDTMRYVNNMHSMHFLFNKSKILITAYNILTSMHLKLGGMDSALIYGTMAYDANLRDQINWNYPLYLLASVYERRGRADSALILYKKAVAMAIGENIMIDVVKNYVGMAKIFIKTGQADSAIIYIRSAVALEKEINYKTETPEAYLLLSKIYENRKMYDSALFYHQNAIVAKDSLFKQKEFQQVQSIAFKEELREREIQQQAQVEQTKNRNKIKIYGALGIAITFLVIALILWNHNKQKQKANVLLHHQNEKIENTLAELKSTQSQLIQSEKMASLGELTAGIAHEIQNPLNFVNNFSEVNSELIAEAEQEMDKGNTGEVKAILKDIKENEQKINLHGKKADAIVKGMLQHARTNSGQKELTDINGLADEYLRLAYNGLRVKDKSFNATLQTEFDPNIGKINIIPQDISRVLLNLYNNAFYAVQEKMKSSHTLKEATGYEPTILIRTKKLSGKVEIKVADNGNGIPEKVLGKIFQPFFTTKPSGQGTGLGLSLTFDIVKAHGGEIKVETKEGDGSAFIIHLPAN